MTFKLTPDQGERFEVEATTRDVLVWEKTTKGASFGQFADGAAMKLADLYKIAWISAKRHGHVDGDLKAFEETHDLDFQMEEEPDPTRSAR